MPIYRQVPSRLPRRRELVKRPLSAMSVSVVASPRFEPANPSRTESGEERLALHKNHEGRAQAVCAMRDYGTTAHGAKRSLVRCCVTRKQSKHNECYNTVINDAGLDAVASHPLNHW